MHFLRHVIRISTLVLSKYGQGLRYVDSRLRCFVDFPIHFLNFDLRLVYRFIYRLHFNRVVFARFCHSSRLLFDLHILLILLPFTMQIPWILILNFFFLFADFFDIEFEQILLLLLFFREIVRGIEQEVLTAAHLSPLRRLVL